MLWACIIVISILGTESLLWAFSINRHSEWLVDHPEYERRLAIKSKVLAASAILSAIYTITMLAVFYYFISIRLVGEAIEITSVYLVTAMCLGSFLSQIHGWVIIARYSCLQFYFWPIISATISKILSKIYNIPPIDSYCASMKKWKEIEAAEKEYRLLLFSFLDIIPDMIWTKDIHGRFTYVNEKTCQIILSCDKEDALGKTIREIEEFAAANGVKNGIADVAEKTDASVLSLLKPAVFFETACMNGTILALRVVKAPIYKDVKGKPVLTGIMGMARNVSVEYMEHSLVQRLLSEGRYEEAKLAFSKHMMNFEMVSVDNPLIKTNIVCDIHNRACECSNG